MCPLIPVVREGLRESAACSIARRGSRTRGIFKVRVRSPSISLCEYTPIHDHVMSCHALQPLGFLSELGVLAQRGNTFIDIDIHRVRTHAASDLISRCDSFLGVPYSQEGQAGGKQLRNIKSVKKVFRAKQ